MAQKWEFSYQAPGKEERVGYSPCERRGQLSVAFTGLGNKRVERSTGLAKINAEWHAEAERHIRQHFTTLFPEITANLTWDDALGKVRVAYPNTRPKTVLAWEKAIRSFRETMPEVVSPCDVSEERVKAYSRKWLATPPKVVRSPDGKRTPTTLSFYLRGMSAFCNHLVDLGILTRNIWKGAPLPGVPGGKEKRKPILSPTEDVVTKFFAWVRQRYPDWRTLHALLDLKATVGCRTMDVCRLKTYHLRDGKITFTADIDKTNRARTVVLPPELFAELQAVAGSVHLWEVFFSDIPRFRKQSNGLPDTFSADTVEHVVCNIFREFSDSHPELPRLSPHKLRNRALTRLTLATGGNVDLAAQVIGVSSQTARRHYIDASQAFATEEAQRQLLGVLSPGKVEPPAPKIEPQG